MATAFLVDDLQEVLPEAPQGNVPAPFPTFLLPGRPDTVAHPTIRAPAQDQRPDQAPELRIVEVRFSF